MKRGAYIEPLKMCSEDSHLDACHTDNCTRHQSGKTLALFPIIHPSSYLNTDHLTDLGPGSERKSERSENVREQLTSLSHTSLRVRRGGK